MAYTAWLSISRRAPPNCRRDGHAGVTHAGPGARRKNLTLESRRAYPVQGAAPRLQPARPAMSSGPTGGRCTKPGHLGVAAAIRGGPHGSSTTAGFRPAARCATPQADEGQTGRCTQHLARTAGVGHGVCVCGRWRCCGASNGRSLCAPRRHRWRESLMLPSAGVPRCTSNVVLCQPWQPLFHVFFTPGGIEFEFYFCSIYNCLVLF